jgi:hypothetical protein
VTPRSPPTSRASAGRAIESPERDPRGVRTSWTGRTNARCRFGRELLELLLCLAVGEHVGQDGLPLPFSRSTPAPSAISATDPPGCASLARPRLPSSFHCRSGRRTVVVASRTPRESIGRSPPGHLAGEVLLFGERIDGLDLSGGARAA